MVSNRVLQGRKKESCGMISSKQHTVFSILSIVNLRKRGIRTWTSEHEASSNAPEVDDIGDDVVMAGTGGKALTLCLGGLGFLFFTSIGVAQMSCDGFHRFCLFHPGNRSSGINTANRDQWRTPCGVQLLSS